MLVAANAYYLSLASDAAEEARSNIETIEQTIPVMIDLADNDLQRTALTALGAARRRAARRACQTCPSSSPAGPTCCAPRSTPTRPR